MTKTKRTRSSAATAGREVEAAALNTAAAPTTNSTRSSGKRQVLMVSDFLETGEGNARSIRYLKGILHRDGRTIRALIEQERRSGTLILSDNQHGYFLAANQGEVERFVRSMKHRAYEIIETARAIEEAAGQQ